MVGFLEILFACLLPSVLWAIHLEQVPISITKKPHVGSSAEFTCKVTGGLDSTYIHWYRAPTGGAPQRLLYLSYSKPDPSWDAGLSSKKLTAHFQDRSISKLLVHKLENADSGHYYCAAWNNYIKVFGSGTKLIVSKTEAKLDPNKIQVLPSITEKDGQVTHICLIEDFYPNIIKVTWEDDKKNAEKNAVLGEIWPPDDNRQSYSVSSWLTLNKPSNKNYRCNYQHEKESGSVLTKSQDTTIVPQTTADCTNRLFTVSFIHRTAYLIYIALLLKSTMYYVIVLFFIYRLQSPIKRQGEKP